MASSRPSRPHPQLSWWGWGDPAEVPDLPEAVLELLRGALGILALGTPPPPIETISLAPTRLTEPILAALIGVVGAAHAASDPETRIRHTGGKSTPDLLRLRAGQATGAPDLVLAPGTHEEILELLRVCSAHRVAVVPFGGGTSVVGGLSPEVAGYAGVLALDLRRLNALVELDEESRLAVLEPGLRGPEAELLLRAHGYTIGHFPQSFEYATLGGFAAARSSGQASAGYGRFDELVLGLRVATPAGSLSLGRAPKTAAGPDLRQLILGSEGALGVITALTVQVRPVPDRQAYDGWRFGSFAEGSRALRHLAQDGPKPTVVRLSDQAETALNLARPTELAEGSDGRCLAIVGFEGSAAEVEAARSEATNVLWGFGGELDEAAGESWARDRFRGPYLRDALLSAGALVETLETVTFWSSLHGLYAAVSEALRAALAAQGTPPIVLCHISHVYASGASLYFTVGCAALEDPIAQWRLAKAAASDAILAAGGSISHHHGVGTDHRDWYLREVGDLAARALRAVKAELDPAWILNPGILIPEDDA
jgi:alkyldihydroxyacetonephosphate synthase